MSSEDNSSENNASKTGEEAATPGSGSDAGTPHETTAGDATAGESASPITPELAEAQRQAFKDEAVRIMTWWRCAGCLGAVLMILLGCGLGVWLTLRSDVFNNDPWVTAEEVAGLNPVPTERRQSLQSAITAGQASATAAEWTALANLWLENASTGEPPLLGLDSRCHVLFPEPGIVELRISLCVPPGLDLPGSLLENAFYNVMFRFAGTFDRERLDLIDLKAYRTGERPEAPIETVEDARALGAAVGRFLDWHPKLKAEFERIQRITVLGDQCEVWFR